MSDSRLDTERLLERLRADDRSATDQLFAKYRPILCRLVRKKMDERVMARLDPSDVVQDALLNACQRLPEIVHSPRVPFYAWLRRIVCDRLIEVYRRHIEAQKRTVTMECRSAEVKASLAQLTESCNVRSGRAEFPSTGAEKSELVRWLLVQLSAHDREILLMKHMEGLNNGECAASLGLDSVAVKKRHLRALRHVRELMQSASECADNCRQVPRADQLADHHRSELNSGCINQSASAKQSPC